ncbi:hypothetical protein H9Y04_41575 [Streptomyces sp. TRM66268-LWL]|uniref:DUF2530 domain-containing protein n=1 Tax=Streptomyces polyasparticus TaxID=2767826 RepID=A0ABR7SWK2_9ACTN|nr:hypothetical protein [Streptomyces polyasparticus]MBC9719035.1 hypothetical protein [Streptomyces polyasparticus]
MDPRNPRSDAAFEPARRASPGRLVAAFLCGALVWIAAGALAVVLLGHTSILWRLLLAVLVSWLVFGAALTWAIALRHREERRAPGDLGDPTGAGDRAGPGDPGGAP